MLCAGYANNVCRRMVAINYLIIINLFKFEMGAFSVGSSMQSDMANSPSWTCRLAVYMIFKKSNI